MNISYYKIMPFKFENNQIKYKVLPIISINCDVDTNKLQDIIAFIFKHFCKLSIYGYNATTNEFWGKKIKKECILHFTLQIINNENNTSSIIINTIFEKNNELICLRDDIKRAINMIF
jgi:hypothetical protein